MKKSWEIDWKFFYRLAWTYQIIVTLIWFCLLMAGPSNHLSHACKIWSIVAGALPAVVISFCILGFVCLACWKAVRKMPKHIPKPIKRVTKPITKDLRAEAKEKK